MKNAYDCGYVGGGRYTVYVYPSGYAELWFDNLRDSSKSKLIDSGMDKAEKLKKKGWELSRGEEVENG